MRKLKCIAVMACTAFLTAGCGQEQNEIEETIAVSSEPVSETEASETTPYLSASDDTIPYSDVQTAMLAVTAAMSDPEGFIAEISEVVEYPLLSDIALEETYARWKSLPETDQTPRYGVVTELPLDPETLYQIVDANTDAMIAANTYIGRRKLNEEDMRFCCEYICDTLNTELPRLPYPGQLDDIDANIAKLTLFEGMGTDNGAVYDDGSMSFSRALSENMIWVTGYEEYPKTTVAHETEHLMQKTSVEHLNEMGLEKSYGFMAAWEDMDIDPLFYNWMVEGSAERLAANLYDGVVGTYLSKVAYVDSMAFVAVLNGCRPDSFAKTTQQPELDVLFEMFRCQSEEEKMELLYLLYANEVIQEEPEGFMDAYEEKLGHGISDDELVDMKIELKVSLLTTLSKYFYRNLAELTAAGKLTFEEICFLISGWELDINSHISYSDSVRTEQILPFLKSYVFMQEGFFAAAAEGSGADAAALMELYYTYYANLPDVEFSMFGEEMNDPWSYVEIGAFDAETNAFINQFFENLADKKCFAAAEYYHNLH